MIHALIFDFDGTILDTEEPEYRTWQEIYARYNATLPLEQWAKAIGSGPEAFDPFSYLEGQIGHPVDRDEIVAWRRERNREIIARNTALPGVETYITEAGRLGLKRAVASSSTHAWVTGHLSRLGLLQYFDYLHCGDEVVHRKPNPEIYLDVLKHFKITGNEAIVLEDSPNGVRAAKAAGIFCVAVPNVVTGHLRLDHADLRLASMADMPLEKLITLAEYRQKQE